MAKTKTKKEKEPVDVQSGKSPMETLQEIFKNEYGEGDLITLAEDLTSSVTDWLPSGSYLIDRMVSNGRGFPFGKVVTISGKKSSGKSTIAAHLVAQAQKHDVLSVYFDTELAFQKDRAEKLGVDSSRLLFGQPDHIQQAFEKCEKVIEVAAANKTKALIVWDSIAATPTKSEVEGEVGEGGQYGEHSKLMSQGFRRISHMVAENNILLFIVNQIKTNTSGYGDEVTYIAKNPLDFHSHVMMEIKQIGKVKDGEEFVAIESNLKISKSRVGSPFKECTIRVRFDSGIDTAWELLEIGKANGKIALEGSWNKVLTICQDCFATGKSPDGTKCKPCKGSGKVQDPNYKQFYSKDMPNMLLTYPELADFCLTA